MPLLFHGDCLEEMKQLDDDSVDLVFCDLPYGQTNCKWDYKIDLEKFWIEIMRIKKTNTPIFFTTTTKFGVDLIKSAPNKCPFRYDLVWVKSAPTGFLSAKKMPMRKHEMVYVFYEKLPFYDLSSHKHKFLKQEPEPVSVVKEEMCKYDVNKNTYGGGKDGRIKISKDKKDHQQKYEPPLPVSVVKEDVYDYTKRIKNGKLKETGNAQFEGANGKPLYEPPLPNSMIEIKSTRGKHSTEKPVALMEWVLKYYSKEGDVVLDPTMGSGSTGVACKNMNREFIGIEMDGEIYEGACDRLD